MNRGQKVVLGVVLVGGTALAISALSKKAEAAPPPVVPPSLVEGYLSDIAACLTLNALEAVKTRFDADYAAGKLTEPEYQQVYAAYLVRYGELVGPATATLDIKAVPVLAGPYGAIISPRVYVDGAWVGSAPLLWTLYPGTYTITFEDKPGGDNPAPGVAYYSAPAAQTVTVAAGQTLAVTGTYTSVPTAVVPPDVVLDSFSFSDVQPFLPSSTHLAYINITNPTNRPINYQVYAYSSDPGDTGQPAALGSTSLGPIPPGSWSTQFGIPMPAVAGTYPIWLRFYEAPYGLPLVFIKRVNTSKTATVAPAAPPTQWPIETQLASIRPYLVLAGVTRYSVYWAWKPGEYMNIFELFVGETVEINVTQACTLTYSGWTWNLVAGYNTIVWGSPPVAPPPPTGWPIETQLASIKLYLLKVWSMIYPQQLYDPAALSVSTLQELIVGQQYSIQVSQACTLSYGGKTWSLAAGWTLITW